ncbi:peptidase S8 [Actinorhabdospora filicis]|uniref:Peptidase S8 n=1 Tax=Actinorhabdospora filicis TaxID=1785913 RepID=A0A9W6W907_9ACTN|nr:S8 family serine peptidase [Actinorhabdospora filicis]GLZ77016.1 peptidase S8 [Actinorhabdospora filicis]
MTTPEGRLEADPPPPPPTAVGTLEPPPPPPPAARPESTWGPFAAIYTVLAGLWAVAWTFLFQGGGWVVWQIGLLYNQDSGRAFWPGVTIAGAVTVALAMLPMLFMRRWPAAWAAGGAWLGASVAMLLLAAPKLVPGVVNELALAAQGALALLIAVVAWLIRRPRRSEPQPSGRYWWAAVVGLAAFVPWTWAGALGSWWETGAAVLAAAGCAALAATVLGERFWAPFVDGPAWRRVLGGGATAGVALFMIGTGFGATGVQLLVMTVAAALGFAIAALQTGARAGRVVALAVGPAVLGPLAFVDSDEFVPLVTGPEFGTWAGWAALIAVGAAWLAGLVYALLSSRIIRLPAVGAGVTVVALAAACAVYYTAGSPGTFGERLFVVMGGQADLSGLEFLPRERRLTETYQRLTAYAEATQKELRAELDSRGLSYTPFYLVNAIAVDTGPESRPWLEERGDVARVLIAPRTRPVPAPASPIHGDTAVNGVQPNITQIGAPEAWAKGFDGTGITIGIADSGVDGTHPALASGYRGGADSWFDPVNGTSAPNDPNGHGTHALGLALGRDGIGVAPGASWMGCANLPRNMGNPIDYTACLQFMLAPFPQGGDPFTAGDPSRAPDIITNSWGCPGMEGCSGDVLRPAVQALTGAGIFFAVAAGNTGPDCGSVADEPADLPESFSVGAVNKSGEVTEFSSRGPSSVGKPDVVAPGEEVVSSVPGGGYTALSGTSMATPHVAGVVALLWQARPELAGDIAGTVAALKSTAVPANGARTLSGEQSLSACGGNVAGAGVVSVPGALGL